MYYIKNKNYLGVSKAIYVCDNKLCMLLHKNPYELLNLTHFYVFFFFNKN